MRHLLAACGARGGASRRPANLQLLRVRRSLEWLEAEPINGVTGDAVPTPLPAALPLFATGLGALSLLGWRRKRKNAAALAAA
jgi:hypothetical protein